MFLSLRTRSSYQKKAPQCLQENVGAPRLSGLKIVPRKHKNRGDWVKERNKWLNGDTMRKWILLRWLNVRWEEESVGACGVLDASEFSNWWAMFCWLDDVAASEGNIWGVWNSKFIREDDSVKYLPGWELVATGCVLIDGWVDCIGTESGRSDYAYMKISMEK